MKKHSVITYVMEPVVPHACAIMTIGGGIKEKHIYARSFVDRKTKSPPQTSSSKKSGKWEKWRILQVTGECATVSVPDVPFGIYELALNPSDPPENNWIANKPQIDWTYPQVARPGCDLRIIGRCLVDISRYDIGDRNYPISYGYFMEENRTVILARKIGKQKFIKIPVEKSNAYEVFAKIPFTMESGDYELFVHNGRGGDAGWSEPFKIIVEQKQREIQKKFYIDEYIRKTNGDVDEAIARVVKEVKASGGGIIEFGTGIYPIKRTIELPRFCILRGQGEWRTCITAPTAQGPVPPWVMITGDGNFTVEDIRLFAVYSVIAIVAPVFKPKSFDEAMKAPFSWCDTRARNVTIRRCRIEQDPSYMLSRRQDADPEWRKWLLSWTATSDGQSHNGFVAVRIRGDGGLIENNQIWGAGSGIILTGCSYIRVTGNNIKVGCSGHGIYIMGHMSWPEDWATNPNARPNPVIGNYSRCVIIEENTIEAHSERARDFCYFNYGAEYCIAARNIIGPMQINNDCEGLAFHLWPAKWAKPKVEQITPTRYRIIDPEGEVRREELVGGVLQVLDGAGIGQVRTIIKREGDEVEIDIPFRYPPGHDSVIAFAAPPPFRRMTLVDNRIEHTGANILLWGDTHDVVVDGNICRDNGHISVWSVRSFEAQKVWGGAAFTQIIHNISETAWMMPKTPEEAANYFGAGIGNPCCRDMNFDGSVGFDFLGLIIRDNLCRNQSGIVYRTRYGTKEKPWKLHDAGIVIERNFADDCQFGVAVEKDAPAIIRANGARKTKWEVVRFSFQG